VCKHSNAYTSKNTKMLVYDETEATNFRLNNLISDGLVIIIDIIFALI
jgi:hypothetical protein